VGKGIFRTIVAAVVVALLAGCGKSETGSASLTKAQFVEEANAVCEKWQEGREDALAAATRKFAGKKSSSEMEEEAVLMILRPYEEATRNLGELRYPEAEEAKVRAIVITMEEAAKRVKADPGTALESDLPFRKANELSEKYGLTRCKA
jgi:hypothetical protein